MATPTNSSGTLQHTEVGGSNNANAGFTFTAGRSAVLVIACYNTSVSNIASVTIGGTAAVRRARIFLDSDHHSVEIWDALSVAGGTSTITIDYGSNTSYASFGVTEWAAGVITGFDTGTENTATGTSTAPAVSTALTTSQAAALTFAVVTNSASTASQGFAGPTSWTQIFLEQNTTITESGRGAWFEHSSAGIKTATFSQTNNVSWIAAIAAYTISGGGGSTGTANPTTGTFTYQGRQASINPFTNVRIREVLINEAGSPVGSRTGMSLLVWYAGSPIGAPDLSYSALTTDANGTTSWSIATGSLIYNQPIFYVATDGNASLSVWTCARMIPTYS